MNKSFTASLLAACLSMSAVAQTTDARTDFITYKIKTGDTFNVFAKKYLQQPVDLVALQKHNQLRDINQLTIDSELRIPRHMLKHTLSKATVMSISCATPIRMVHSKPLAVGMVLKEGSEIDVPAECHVALLLEDSSVIRLPSGATLKLTTLRKNLLESAPEVRLDLSRGRIELDVNKQGRTPSIPFEVRTPISVMGVRGTEFRVGYSPDDKAGQVEVLGGVVETKGTADSESRAITSGLGVPVDGQGKALAIEKLLPPPLFASAQATQGNNPSYVVQLHPVPLAEYYIANHAATANLSGTRGTENLLAPEVFVPRLTKQAVFYQLTSVSPSGLVGTEHYYAFCASPSEPAMARCGAMFDAPLADNAPIVFSLSRVNDGQTQAIVRTKTLQAKNGRFTVQGLPAGHYQWQLSYDLPTSPSSTASDTTVRQSGTFELIALPVR